MATRIRKYTERDLRPISSAGKKGPPPATESMREHARKFLPVTVVAVIGLAISIWIAIVHGRLTADANYTSFCNVSASVNCDVVLTSRYATLAGVAVSTWAILYYLAVVGLTIGIAVTDRARSRHRLATATLAAALWGVVFSIYMAVIAFGVLHTVCVMCTGLYLVNITLFLVAWRLRRGTVVTQHDAIQRALRDRAVWIGTAIAALAVVAIGGWEAFGRGAHGGDAAAIARERPDFYRWYFAQPLVQVAPDGSHARGNPAASVTIVEFSDFECSHCAAFHESVETVLRRLGQRVRLVFRHFPLDSACNPKMTTALHPGACLAAAASECAADQGKFWQYHDLLFAHQQQLGRQFLIDYAAQLGLDVPRFTACLQDEPARARVSLDAQQGAALEIDSTPTCFINGRRIKGALDVELLNDAITLAGTKP